jgi:hypothetical protein
MSDAELDKPIAIAEEDALRAGLTRGRWPLAPRTSKVRQAPVLCWTAGPGPGQATRAGCCAGASRISCGRGAAV